MKAFADVFERVDVVAEAVAQPDVDKAVKTPKKKAPAKKRAPRKAAPKKVKE